MWYSCQHRTEIWPEWNNQTQICRIFYKKPELDNSKTSMLWKTPPPQRKCRGASPDQGSEQQAEGHLRPGGCFVSKVSAGHIHARVHRLHLCGRFCLGELLWVATEPAWRKVFQHLASAAWVCNLSSSSAVCNVGASDQQLGQHLQLVRNANSRSPPWPADSEPPGGACTPRSEKHCLELKENKTRQQNAMQKGRDKGHLGTTGKTWITTVR